MKKSDFYYDLPEELIAQTPLEKRDTSRLMVLDKKTGQVQHKHFYDIIDYLQAGDCLVINDTKVIPARLYGQKTGTGGAVEVLLLKDLGEGRWECIVYPGRRLKEGANITFGDGRLTATIDKVLETGNRIISFRYEGIFLEILEELGEMPLPHYIKEHLSDPDRYQTVYCREPGSAAAPTAGLHFTPELMERIREKGVVFAPVTLHVGLGTFRPVKEEEITDHVMHSEQYFITPQSAEIINQTRQSGHRVIAVGTTSCRTLETVTDENHVTHPGTGNTDIFIYPGYTFKGLDALITNFHLPESTLVMLVSALAGRENILNAYRQAVEEKYRFFSFGDAMFIC
ncbi:tRNA preQ1(34) S-adenosylmethionine ribosyltransferase-isomerase QueA [Intestinimonas butyriciproducens]|uniref:tRNA preQ1(34) S-adenosylmethionine ribosyltransferase-isomerase QueA n=1 Tax=Intestinimonas butyriciproducens TaxID=1297617 RepID=UPI00195AA63E|nr:tRNA preQ1(34) S-adenosylmethionine ribosyltransferase-isomerase QueA [Intestinimonas butyriciproducens]MBM6919381.1 tRNA preQ1(34) S-adenosylmethionine ribosyltransferase-isomerase QueA [Intestinimonas butyriciproducens]